MPLTFRPPSEVSADLEAVRTEHAEARSRAEALRIEMRTLDDRLSALYRREQQLHSELRAATSFVTVRDCPLAVWIRSPATFQGGVCEGRIVAITPTRIRIAYVTPWGVREHPGIFYRDPEEAGAGPDGQLDVAATEEAWKAAGRKLPTRRKRQRQEPAESEGEEP